MTKLHIYHQVVSFDFIGVFLDRRSAPSGLHGQADLRSRWNWNLQERGLCTFSFISKSPFLLPLQIRHLLIISLHIFAHNSTSTLTPSAELPSSYSYNK